jgi:predicted PurR-regulated permease PerM
MSRFASFCVLVAILVVIGVLFYHVIASFILPLFLATLLVVIFRPMYESILERVGKRAYLAATLTTLGVVIIVFAPFVTIASMAFIEASSALTRIKVGTMRDRLAETRKSLGLEIQHADKWRQVETKLRQALYERKPGDAQQFVPDTIAEDFDSLVTAVERDGFDIPDEQAQFVRDGLVEIHQHRESTLDYDTAVQEALGRLRALKQRLYGGPMWATIKEYANPSDEDFRSLLRSGLAAMRETLVSTVGNVTSFVGKTIFGLVITIVAMFFFFADGKKMADSIMELTPLDRAYETELLEEFNRVTRAVVVATLLSAVVQGLLAGIGYYFAGLQSVFLLMLLTTVLAMVPFFGAATVWFPACLWLYFYEDRPVAAIILGIYGAGVVSTIDNVIKPWVLHGQSNLHPLAALLSVLGGVSALGPIGILVGPMVFVFLATILKILRRELTRMERLPSLRPEGAAQVSPGQRPG